ncbi:DUF1934 domain-containing protein [Paenibacillus sp. SAFN-117]|uniref:DUF1934 domain-containing protein n=1 Tax=Paenibacillus sp. SAFN-117 TaxID=3436860 RepID=UPI003F8000BB
MAAHKEIRLTVRSLQEDEETSRTFTAAWYPKEKNGYIRYQEEESDMGNTTTTVKVGREEIKVIRHGDLQSEQTFILHRWIPGFYRTQQGIIHLETYTHRLAVHLVDGIGKICWDYELRVQGSSAGRFSLTLDTEPALLH